MGMEEGSLRQVCCRRAHAWKLRKLILLKTRLSTHPLQGFLEPQGYVCFSLKSPFALEGQ